MRFDAAAGVRDAMADRVLLHIGVPKSGTSYLQFWLWRHRDALGARGVLLPGSRVDHALASHVVREDPSLRSRPLSAQQSWERLRKEIAAWPGSALVSHEFFGAATADQAGRAVESLAPARVELVVTARDALSVLTAAWQESLKYGDTTALEDFSTHLSDSPMAVWNWRTTDAGEVLRRWAPHVPPEQVHVVVTPRRVTSEPVLWRHFASLLVPDPDELDVTGHRRNPSMGLVQAEVLRRVTPHLLELDTGIAVRTWIRDYLGGRKLALVGGESFHPSAPRVDECRERSEATIRLIEEAGYHVVGDLEDLRVPAELPSRRTPEDVCAEEVAEETARLAAAVLLDLRASRQRLRTARRRVERLRNRSSQDRRLSRRAAARLRRSLGRVRPVWSRS